MSAVTDTYIFSDKTCFCFATDPNLKYIHYIVRKYVSCTLRAIITRWKTLQIFRKICLLQIVNFCISAAKIFGNFLKKKIRGGGGGGTDACKSMMTVIGMKCLQRFGDVLQTRACLLLVALLLFLLKLMVAGAYCWWRCYCSCWNWCLLVPNVGGAATALVGTDACWGTSGKVLSWEVRKEKQL